jgi:phage shock protein C
MMTRRLTKSVKNRLLLGVCGGIADYFSVDPVIPRVLFIAASFFSGAGVLLYLLLAALMPRADLQASEPLTILKDNLKTAGGEASGAGRRIVELLRGGSSKSGSSSGSAEGYRDPRD